MAKERSTSCPYARDGRLATGGHNWQPLCVCELPSDRAGEAPSGQKRDETGSEDRLDRQIEFILELDRAKTVLRRSYLTDGSRNENDGEHMWHVAVAALVLAEYSDRPVDVAKVVSMLLVHDVVEIDAGDTFVYDAGAHADKAAREQAAADRLFGMLPRDQETRFRELWEEFEARATAEAHMAAAVDRLLPLLLNRASGGRSWREHQIRSGQVLHVNASVADASARLGSLVRSIVSDAVRAGMLAAD